MDLEPWRISVDSGLSRGLLSTVGVMEGGGGGVQSSEHVYSLCTVFVHAVWCTASKSPDRRHQITPRCSLSPLTLISSMVHSNGF